MKKEILRVLVAAAVLSVACGVAGAVEYKFRVRKRICEMYDTCPATNVVSPEAPQYSVALEQDPITDANQAAVSFLVAGAQAGDVYTFSINDSSPATPAITGAGAIASASHRVSGLGVASLHDGTITLRVTVSRAGLNGAPAIDTASKDAYGPDVSALAPPDNDGAVSPGTDLVITFSENVQKGSGDIVIHKSDDNSVVETIPVGSAQVDVSGGAVTIDPSADLDAATGYYITAPATAFEDMGGRDFYGFSGGTAWNFSTAAGAGAPDASCSALLANAGGPGSLPDGMYAIDPDGAGGNAPFDAYCDMTTDGGGWTVVAISTTPSAWSVGAQYALSHYDHYIDDSNYTIDATRVLQPSSHAQWTWRAYDPISVADMDTRYVINRADYLAVNPDSSDLEISPHLSDVPLSGWTINLSVKNHGCPANQSSYKYLRMLEQDAYSGIYCNIPTLSAINLTSADQNYAHVTICASGLRGYVGPGCSEFNTSDEGRRVAVAVREYGAGATPPSGYTVAIDQSMVNATNQDAVSFTFSGAEVGATFHYSLDDASPATPPLSGFGTIASASQQVSGIDATPLADGTLVLTAYLSRGGLQGGDATDGVVKDATPPAGYAVSLSPSPISNANKNSVVLAITGGEAGASYNYGIDDAVPGGEVSGTGTMSSANQSFSGISVASLPDGDLDISLTLGDAAGNVGLPASGGAIKDTVAPSGYAAAFTTDPVNSQNVGNAGFSITGGEIGATYSYTIDDTGSGSPLGGSGTIGASPEHVTGIDVSSLANGTLILEVVLTDVAGNQGLHASDTVIKASGGPGAPGNYYGAGYNEFGDIGLGWASHHESTYKPVDFANIGVRNVSRFITGPYHGCMLTTDGLAWCWGRNNTGQVGNGTTTNQNSPVAVTMPPGRSFVEVAAGGGDYEISYNVAHSCAVDDLGAAWCWGGDYFGQLGNGGANTNSSTPVAATMPPATAFTQITLGTYYSCALDTDGNAWCWGRNDQGQLGDGTTTTRSTPVAVTMPPATAFTLISAGHDNTCALDTGGAAWCWGVANSVGDGTASQRSVPTAVAMPPGRTFAHLAAGGGYACAVADDGTGWCWGTATRGYFMGQLGNGSTGIKSVPTAVAMPAGRSFSKMSANFAFTCALATDGTGWCWGRNGYGVYGAAVSTSYTPVQVPNPGGKLFVDLAAGSGYVSYVLWQVEP